MWPEALTVLVAVGFEPPSSRLPKRMDNSRWRMEPFIDFRGGGEMVPELPRSALSSNPPVGSVGSASESGQEDGGNQKIANFQTPKGSGDDLEAPPPKRARARLQGRKSKEVTNFAPDVNVLRGITWAPFRLLTKTLYMQFAPLRKLRVSLPRIPSSVV